MSKSQRRRMITILIITWLVTLVCQCLAIFTIATGNRENKLQQARLYGQSIASAIQLTMDNTVDASESLKYFYLQYNECFFPDFENIAANIAADNPSIGSMYIAPDAIIRVAYPKEVNAATIGFEMLKDPEQGPRAQLAIDTGKITVAGPHDLVEGGVGFIIRNPIFADGKFKGFSIIVLDWDRFVEQILSNVEAPATSYNYAVWKNDHDETAVTDEYGYIFKNCDTAISDKIDIEFSVPNDTWHLNVEPKDGWGVFNETLPAILISIALSALVLVLAGYVYSSNEHKRQLQIEQKENEAKTAYMEQLSSALDKARRADAAKTTFLSKVSHDIRTPLNGIIGLMDINERHADDRRLVDENRKKARTAANHLLALISDILELSKIDDENVQLIHEPFNIIDLANDVLTIIEQRALESGITVHHEELPENMPHPYVYGSPLHIREILINILGNSIKYNKPNGSIYTKLEIPDDDGRIVSYRITVQDTGIGMSPEFMKKMFEPFSQEHNDARSVYQGTGLGMAIVKSLLDKMNGSIEVESEVGIGSTFVITIPFEIANEEDVRIQSSADTIDLSGMKILIAEDNVLNMEIIETILNDSGVITTQAHDGLEALEIFKAGAPGTFDLILMDLMMPRMDGYEATREIRALNRTDAKSIPIFAMTANAFAEDAQKCMAAGMNAHLTKPIDVCKLLTTLSALHHKTGH